MSRAVLLCPVLLLSSLTLGGAGCAVGSGMQDKFDMASRSYNRAVRWNDLDAAMAYLPSESQPGFLAEREDADDEIEIVDYERVRLSLDPGNAQGSVRVIMRWHYDDSIVVETSVVDQVWQFFDGTWVLVDEWQIKGEPLFLFANREDGETDVPHPYLPGLESFRETRMIGLSDAEKRKKIREAKRAAKEGASDDRASLTPEEAMTATPEVDAGTSEPPQGSSW